MGHKVEIDGITYQWGEKPKHKERRVLLRIFAGLMSNAERRDTFNAKALETSDIALAEQVDEAFHLKEEELIGRLCSHLTGLIDSAHRNGAQFKIGGGDYWQRYVIDMSNADSHLMKLIIAIYGDLIEPIMAAAQLGDGTAPSGAKKASPIVSESSPDTPASPSPVASADAGPSSAES